MGLISAVRMTILLYLSFYHYSSEFFVYIQAMLKIFGVYVLQKISKIKHFCHSIV